MFGRIFNVLKVAPQINSSLLHYTSVPLSTTSNCIRPQSLIKCLGLNVKQICTSVSISPLLRDSTTLCRAPNIFQTQSRTVTKFSLKRGKRKSVRAVLDRFYRLDWGGWIRTRSGRHKKLWKKKENLRRRLRQHVFCNATQSWLLDKMVTKYWRQPHYYVDDPYEPYHTREEFLVTRKKPLP